MNIYDWGGGGLIMGRPKWMVDKNYPAVVYVDPARPRSGIAASNWPYGELYYNTRYVYAANEFTPQQSMRGKQALYGYLYAIRPNSHLPATEKVAKPMASVPTGSSVNENTTVTLSSNTVSATIYYTIDGTEPSATSGLKYTEPIVITEDLTIKAIAVKKGMLDSETAVFEYFIEITSVVEINVDINKESQEWMVVSPNPVRVGEPCQIKFNIPDGELKDCYIIVYSSLGEKIVEDHQLKPVTEIHNLRQGYYIIQLLGVNNQYRQTRNFVVIDD